MTTVTRPQVAQVRPPELVDMALSGRIRLPSFQRSYRWRREDVVKLFDSILRGYPVGDLLMWSRPADSAELTIGPLVLDVPATPEALWVIDGQQRITSLVGALAAPPDAVDPRFRIFFDLRTESFVSAGQRDDVPDHWFPLPTALSNSRTLSWQRERPWLAERDFSRCDELVTAIRDYPIPMYVVKADDEQTLREIFDRLNNFGRRLRRAEIFNALHTVSGQMKPSGLASLAESISGFGYGEVPEQVLMQSVLAVRGGRIDRDFRAEFLHDQDRHESFQLAEKALGTAVEFLRDEVGIPHLRLLPYMLFLPVLVRFAALFGYPEGRAAELLRRWVWRGSVLGVTPQGNTVALRKNASAVHDDPIESADRLLKLLPATREWLPDLRATKLNQARAKVNLLGMLSARPRILVPGEGDDGRTFSVGDPIDSVRLLDGPTSPLVPIVESGTELGGGIANRLVHPGTLTRADIDRAFNGPTAVSGEILLSHFMDSATMECWRRGDHQGFLTLRARRIATTIIDHVQEGALFGFPDGADITQLLEPGDPA